jgi:DNA-binding winged helix-turn-helix (wHTH) protein
MPVLLPGFELDVVGRRLLHDGVEVSLERRVYDLLLYLVQQRERVVSKQELLASVWGARVLSEGVLSNAVAKLRKALGQRPDDKQPIETVHGRGYRFRGVELKQDDSEPAREVRARSPFVGREPLMRAMRERLLRVPADAENVIVLAGEAGIGKSRTAREIGHGAAASGFTVWSAAAHEGAGAPPYWPWMQLLRLALAELPESDFPASPAREALAQLLPELERCAAPEREPQRARFQLFDAVRGLLDRAAARAPLLVLLDDIQFADQPSVELLTFVARALTAKRVLFLVTLRTGEAPRALQPSLEQLARAADVHTLSPLSLAEVVQLVGAFIGHAALEPRRARALHERTQGNPLFVRHTLAMIVERDDWSLVDEALPYRELPPALRFLIRRRLAGLSAATRETLEAAAVIGLHFDIPLLAAMLERSVDVLLEALEPALELALVEPARGDPDAFVFSHVLVRDSLYEELPVRVRGTLHGTAARALAGRTLRESARQESELAFHALHALPFDPAFALDACSRAARAAQEVSAFEAAAELLRRAIHKLEAERSAPALRVRLLRELGEHEFYAGHIASAWAAFCAASEAAMTNGLDSLLADLSPRMVDCLELGVGDERVAAAVTERALQSVAADDRATHASLLAQQAELSGALPVAERLALLDRAAMLANESGSAGAVLEVAHSHAILRDPRTLAKNDAAASDFLALVERHPEAARTMRYRSLRRFGALLTRYLCALTRGDLAAADAALSSCRRVADESRVSVAGLTVQLADVGRALAEGRLSAARQVVHAAMPQVTSETPIMSLAWSACCAALLEAEAKYDALRALELDLGPLHVPRSARVAVYLAIARAQLYFVTQRREPLREALAAIDPAQLAHMPVNYGDLGALCSLLAIYVHVDARERIAPLYQRLAPYASLNAVGPRFDYLGAVDHYLGIAALRLGDAEGARLHLRAAIALNQQLGSALFVARSEAALARC